MYTLPVIPVAQWKRAEFETFFSFLKDNLTGLQVGWWGDVDNPAGGSQILNFGWQQVGSEEVYIDIESRNEEVDGVRKFPKLLFKVKVKTDVPEERTRIRNDYYGWFHTFAGDKFDLDTNWKFGQGVHMTFARPVKPGILTFDDGTIDIVSTINYYFEAYNLLKSFAEAYDSIIVKQ